MELLLLLASVWLGIAIDTGKNVFESHAAHQT
jgi:hypothetical protein